MAKYVKKKIVVEAEQYRIGLEDGIDSIEVAICHGLDETTYKSPLTPNKAPYILTLEGKHYISQGDFIIKGVRGERYPCKKDIFEETYNLIT